MVKEKEQIPKVVWDKKAYSLLEKACKRIKKDSLANAEKVKTEVLAITKSLASNPEKYQKINTNETTRAIIGHLKSIDLE